MAMDIPGLGSTHASARSRVNEQQNGTPSQGRAGAVTPSANPASEDTVKISATAQALQNAQAQLDTQPEVDSDRVAELKKAIESGEYQVDAQRVAGRMLQFDKLFG